MARKIVITSGKGGVGKTTVTANLGISLARRGLRVALLDFDIGLNNLDVAMHIDQQVVFDLVDVVEGRCRITQALIQDINEPSLYIMPSCHQAKRIISVDAVKKLISKMEDSYDYILIDSPAGIETSFRRAVCCANEAIVIVTPHLSAIRDADKALQYMRTLDLLSLSVVVNRVRGDLVARGEMLDAFEVFSLLGATPLGVLPDDDDINCYSTTTSNKQAFNILASNLHNGTQVMFDCVSPYKGLFGKMRARAKRH